MLVINSAVYIGWPYLEGNNQLLNVKYNLPAHILYGKEEEDMWTAFCVSMVLLACPWLHSRLCAAQAGAFGPLTSPICLFHSDSPGEM